MRNTILKLALAALLAAALAAPPALAQSAGTPLSAVVISVSVTIWPAIVADKKGYFKDEGLDLDFINSGASTRSVQQVAAGSRADRQFVDGGHAARHRQGRQGQGVPQQPRGRHPQPDRRQGHQVGGGAQGQARDDRRHGRHHQPVVDRDGQGQRPRPGEGRRAVVFRRHLGAARGAGRGRGRRHHAVDAAELPGGAERLCRSRPGRALPRRIPDDDLARQRGLGEGHEKELLAFIRAHNKAVRYMSDPAHRQEVSQMLADASKSSLDDALKTWDVCMQVKAFVADGGISDSRHRAGARHAAGSPATSRPPRRPAPMSISASPRRRRSSTLPA